MGNAHRLIAIALIALTPALAAAEDPEPAPSTEPNRARQLYELGKKLFESAEFGEAALLFGESFELDPRPAALFNRGRCLEEAGDIDGAIAAYRSYVALDPGGVAAEEARTRTLALERRRELLRQESAPPPEALAPPADDEPDRGNARRLKLAGLVGAGVGGVAMAAGIGFGIRAGQLSGDLSSDRSAWTEDDLADVAAGKRAEKLQVGLLVAGAAIAAAGGVVYYLGDRAERRLEIAPAGAGATVTARF